MPRTVGSLENYPARALAAWYAMLILFGSMLLYHPVSSGDPERPISLIDALFTATSASCVTGLVVLSTPHDFSLFGQAVILVLIQLGGIGVMTVATWVFLSWRGQESLREKATVVETLGAKRGENMRAVLRQVVTITAAVELVVATILFARFVFVMPWRDALWHAVFHAVSAFCNAGFALADDSLSAWRGDVTVNLAVMAAIVCGGIGYPVIRDLQRNFRIRSGRPRWERLTLNTRLVLIGTVGLLTFGTAFFLLLEWNNSLAEMPAGTAVMAAMFHSVSARTAGFNTVDLTQLTQATLFILILLMFVGAAPGSAGGGFKVSTFMVLILLAWSRLTGQQHVRAFRRTIPVDILGRGVTTVLLFAVVGTLGVGGLLVLGHWQRYPLPPGGTFLDVLFEAVSALGTVGLSLGHTGVLATPEKLVVIGLMFVGRIGPTSVAAVISRPSRAVVLKYPDEDVLIG